MCKFGGDPAICLREEPIFVKSQKCPCHVTFDLDLDLEHTLDAGPSGTIVCKFGRNPAICLVEEVFAKCLQTDRQTDGRTGDRRRTIALAHGMS